MSLGSDLLESPCVQSFVCCVCTCVCMFIWFMRFWSNPSFLSSNGIVSFTYSNLIPDALGICKAELSFLQFTHRLWLENKTCLFWFFSLSRFLVFLQGGQGGNHRRQCKTSLLQWPCDLLGENRNTHTSSPHTSLIPGAPCIIHQPFNSVHSRFSWVLALLYLCFSKSLPVTPAYGSLRSNDRLWYAV